MCDSLADPQSMGCRFLQGKGNERLNSSASVSDLSEAISDSSLSTSPGSDIPTQQVKSFMAMSTSPASVSEASSHETQPCRPRKKPVVRQLSSNPYLASSEMSPSEDHPHITGSHSYAAGDSRFYANDEDIINKSHSDYYSNTLSQRANSYPLISDCLDESDEEEDDGEDNDDDFDDNSDEKHKRHSKTDNHGNSDHNSIANNVPLNPSHQNHAEVLHNQNEIEPLRPGVCSTPLASSPELVQTRHHKHHQCNQESWEKEYQYPYHNHHHHNHFHQQQQYYRNSYSYSGNSTSGRVSNIENRVNGFKWNSNQNVPSSVGKPSANIPEFFSKHHQCSDVLGTPKSREINSWGHFYKQSEGHYKYRRSHYSSDSEEESPSNNAKNHSKQSSNRISTCKSHVPPTRCHHRTSLQSPCVHRSDINTGRPHSSGERKEWSQNGIKPHEFKERFQLMKRWFSECNDGQKNILLKGILDLCELPQLHLLSVHMSKELHHGCPSNCEDIITWLPTDLATKVMSYLDPVSLCHAAQVCRVWRELAEDQSLWRRFCCQTKWRLSKAAEHKQVISHMCPEGSIQWKNVFAERYRLRNNWLKGRCTIRTFEGHTQGISCVQFDDSRIVSGSSDKTIKVWNMRTNASWSVQTLMGHHGTVRCLHLEGNRLVSGSCDTTIKVWDLSTQDSWSSIACKVTMTGHTDTVRCLQADDDKVISGSYDKTLKIWDLKSGELRRTLSGHQAYVLCVHFSETKIVSGSADKTIKVWNYEGQCMMTLKGHQDAVTCLMFDSTRIVSGSLDHNLKFWDIHTGECLNTIDWKKAEGHTDVVRCLQADSWRVVSAADDKTIKVWNLATGERLVTLRNHTDGVTCLQFNDFIIVSGSYDKSVKLWDFSSC